MVNPCTLAIWVTLAQLAPGKPSKFLIVPIWLDNADLRVGGSDPHSLAPRTSALSSSPRFDFRRMRNTNGRKTASIAIPTTRFAAYLVKPATNLVFKDNSFGRVVGGYFEFPAVDTAKCKDVPLRLSGLHRKTPVGAGTEDRKSVV